MLKHLLPNLMVAPALLCTVVSQVQVLRRLLAYIAIDDGQATVLHATPLQRARST